MRRPDVAHAVARALPHRLSEHGGNLCSHPVAKIALLWAYKGTAPDPGTLVKIALRGPDPKEVCVGTHHKDQIHGLSVDMACRRQGRPIPQGQDRAGSPRRLHPYHQLPNEGEAGTGALTDPPL